MNRGAAHRLGEQWSAVSAINMTAHWIARPLARAPCQAASRDREPNFPQTSRLNVSELDTHRSISTSQLRSSPGIGSATSSSRMPPDLLNPPPAPDACSACKSADTAGGRGAAAPGDGRGFEAADAGGLPDERAARTGGGTAAGAAAAGARCSGARCSGGGLAGVGVGDAAGGGGGDGGGGDAGLLGGVAMAGLRSSASHPSRRAYLRDGRASDAASTANGAHSRRTQQRWPARRRRL